MRRPRARIAEALEVAQRLTNRVPDVEAPAGAGEVTLAPPPHVTLHLVARVESVALDEALGQAERHRGVVGPLPWLQSKRIAADHVGDGLERPRALELHRRADRIADGEAEERPAIALMPFHMTPDRRFAGHSGQSTSAHLSGRLIVPAI